MTEKEILAAFAPVPITDDSAVRFDAMRAGFIEAESFALSFSFCEASQSAAFAALGRFAAVIIASCPAGIHRDAAVAHLMLARGLIHESIRSELVVGETSGINYRQAAAQEVLNALTRANGGVALEPPKKK